MFSVDDIRTPRDRVNDGMMRQLLEGECCPISAQPRRSNPSAPSHACLMPEGHPLAMVYSPCQHWRSIYAPDMALRRGTMFKELDMPLEITKGGNIRGK